MSKERIKARLLGHLLATAEFIKENVHLNSLHMTKDGPVFFINLHFILEDGDLIDDCADVLQDVSSYGNLGPSPLLDYVKAHLATLTDEGRIEFIKECMEDYSDSSVLLLAGI